MQSEKPSSIKSIVLCGVSFIAISYLVFRTDLPKAPNIFLYNLVIIAALQELGFHRSAVFLGGSIFFTVLISMGASFYYIWNVPVFFILFFIVDGQIKRHNYHSHIMQTRIEEIKEDMNVLADGHARHKKEAAALEKKEERYNRLKDVVSILSSTLSSEKVAEHILDNSLSIVGKSETGLLFLVDTKKQELNLIASRTEGSAKSKKGDILDEWVFKQRQVLLVEDIRKDFRFSEDKIRDYAREFRSVISCPLMEGKKVTGVLRLESQRPYNYNSEDLRLLDIICDLGAVSMENSRLYRQTLELAIRDGLTGLYLRRYFLERLKEELSRALRDNTRCSFLMIDIDNFKNYNDEYGHTAGDILLRSIAKLLRDFTETGIAG
ncbi:MAG: sensor domain-containing diguanylate cyclase, partial [Candidatus Omnitrophota bacterium]